MHRTLSAQLGLLALCLAAVLTVSLAVNCPVSSCDIDDPNIPSMWMNTSTMASKLTGLSFTLYPMRRNGQAFLGAYAQLNVTALQELQPFNVGEDCFTKTTGIKEEGVNARVLREVDWSQLCCEMRLDWDMLEPTINRTTAYVKVTDPSYPDFEFNLAFSLVNDSISYRVPGTPNTGGEDFNITYSEFATKLNLDVSNWPWAGLNNETGGDTNPSYLKFHFIGFGVVEEAGNITVWDKGLSAFYSAQTLRSYVELNFLKIVNLDGIDYAFSPHADDEPATAEGLNFVGGPFAITACQDKRVIANPYWTNLTYDPTLTALYDDPATSDISVTPEAAAKRRLPAAAYAVPIAIVVLVLAAVAVVIFVAPVNKFFFGDKSDVLRKPARVISDQETAEPAPFNQKNTVTDAPSSSDNARGSWVRSTRIEH